MKAVVCTKYGPPEVLQLQEVAKPAPRKNEICIKIFATAVTASDCIVRGFKVPAKFRIPMALVLGFRRPRNPILGMVLAGEVESAGPDIKRFRKADQVFAFNPSRFGSYAEYICLPENLLIAPKPSNASYEEAAAIPYGGMLALSYLRKGNIQSGQKVLIYGASGANGTAAVQLARHYGAEVSAACSPANFELVRSLGASTVIDYTQEDLTNSAERYDLVLDAAGKSKSSSFKLQCEKALTPGGKYISVDDGSPKLSIENLILLKELVEAGRLRAVIDRVYPLEQIAEAHRYVDTGHKRGNVVITVRHNGA